MTEGNSLWAMDILIGVVLAGLSWWNTTMWNELKETRRRVHDQTNEVNKLNVFVVGNFVSREELRDSMREMTAAVTGRIDKMEVSMDRKMADIYTELKHKVDKA
jgi:undecaprenyl pyrophosphate synthase